MTPYDGAFNDLDPVWVNRLQNETWNAHLQHILRYHIYDGDLPITELGDEQTITMRSGDTVVVTRRPGTLRRVRVNGILVLALYNATNGFAYMLEEVLLPPWMDLTLLDLASSTTSLSILTSLIYQAELESSLIDPSAGLTVLAPTDDAFTNLGSATLDLLLSDGNQELLQAILLYHIIDNGEPHPAILFDGGEPLPTLLRGETVTIVPGTPATVQGKSNQATIVLMDVVASNGVAHVIDTVLTLE